MAQITYRANLSAKSFPFISNNWGQSIIVPGPDNAFNRQVTSDTDLDKDVGIPQIYYCHNVVPTSHGFQSVGYSTIVSGVAGKIFRFQFLLRDGDGNKTYLGITAAGEFYTNSGSGWVYKTTYGTGNNQITATYVSGITYIWIETIGCIKYDFSSATFVSVTLTGLSVASIIGICSAFGYLIAWDSTSVAWSSTIDAEDFTPDLLTGAGGGSVEGVKGSITFCLPHTLGFFVYTTNNIVAALYSGNERFPFNFREIVNSGGCASNELISYDSNTGNHYAYTTSGFQLISAQQAQTIFSEITDFISGQLFEDFDETTKVFTTSYLTATLQKKLTVVANRYLILSYGINSLTHSLLYDLAQKRWGKLKLPHVDCFEYQTPNAGVFEIPKQSIAFLQEDGTILITSFSVNNIQAAGVILLGKYQYVRSRLLSLDEILVENVYNANFGCSILSALDGKVGTWTTPYGEPLSGTLKQYKSRVSAVNHSLLFTGNFHLTSLVLKFHPTGDR